MAWFLLRAQARASKELGHYPLDVKIQQERSANHSLQSVLNYYIIAVLAHTALNKE